MPRGVHVVIIASSLVTIAVGISTIRGMQRTAATFEKQTKQAGREIEEIDAELAEMYAELQR